jgi:hypothetical protein
MFIGKTTVWASLRVVLCSKLFKLLNNFDC